jgi:hypothetical protein
VRVLLHLPPFQIGIRRGKLEPTSNTADSVPKLCGSAAAGAGDLVRSGQSQISALSGQFATCYGLFAAGAGPALDDLAGADERLSTRPDLDSVALQQIWF